MRLRSFIQFLQPPREVVLAPATPEPSFSAADLEAARREAYQRGFEDASAMLETQLVEQREELVHLQQQTFQSVANQHESLIEQLRAALPDLTMETVRRVLAGVEPDRAAVTLFVNELLSEIAPGPGLIEISLSERDLQLIAGYEADFREKYPQLEFRLDAALRPGDCLLRSRFGALDGRLATKLKTVERFLR